MELVLLPGMDGTGTLFEPFIEALGGRFKIRVVRYPTTEPHDYAQLETLARAQLPESGPFVILGESFSGPLAITLAAAEPSRVKGVILCASFACNPRPLFSGLRPLTGALPVRMVPQALLSYLLLGDYATPPLRSALATAIAQVSPATFRARVRSVLAADVTRQLSSLGMPVMYLRATHDRVVPRAAFERIMRAQPNTRLVQIDAPHFLLQSAAAEAAQAVTAFIEEVKGGEVSK